MNEDFTNEVERRWGRHERRSRRGRVWAGFFLLLVGGLLLLKILNVFFFPAWFFTWPVFLVAIGLFIGAKHGFRGGFWLLPILIGGLLLANEADPSLRLDRFIAPFIIIAIGLVFIFRPKRHDWRKWKRGRAEWQEGKTTASESSPVAGNTNAYTADRRDFIDVTAVFGGVKKNVLSKNFQGGDIVSLMGGSEIDLTQADFTGRITIDPYQSVGGTAEVNRCLLHGMCKVTSPPSLAAWMINGRSVA